MEACFLKWKMDREYQKKETSNFESLACSNDRKGFSMTRPRSLLLFLVLGLWLLLTLAACDGDIADNPLGYTYVVKTMQGSDQKKTVPVSPSRAKPVTHLRPYGIGLPPEAFVNQYGSPLAPSQPPTQLWFKATLDAFPAGSVMIVGFDRSSIDSAPRANEISYVAGDKHVTTITQAETIAESFLPDDAQGPTLINKYDTHANTCQSETFTSATLATLFPAQDFLDASGKVAKAGTVTLSLFPHYNRAGGDDTHINGVMPDQPNAISTFLLTLGTKPYC
jgi:hypothetical protein